VGHPIFFDKNYGKKNLDINIKNKININRLLLHCSEINFIHPSNGNKTYIQAPLDKIFKEYLQYMI